MNQMTLLLPVQLDEMEKQIREKQKSVKNVALSRP